MRDSLAVRQSSRPMVRAKWPRWFTPKTSSKPSLVRPGVPPIPALLISAYSGSPRSRKPWAHARTDARSARSSGRKSTCSLPVSAAIRATAASPFGRDRQARYTRPPRRAKSAAVARPIPVFAPVTRNVCPLSSPTHFTSIRSEPSLESTGRAVRGGAVYEKDGERYFVVDGHMHYWNAAPDNWVPGQEKYAKGWIDCFHAYMGLAPPETHWPIEKFQKYSEDDLMKDIFADGHVDMAIFQPTYLKEWYKEGFNTTERNALMGEKHPGRFVYNTRFDPRDGDAGLEELRRNVERFGSRGVKLYTAEWNAGSRGYKLTDPAAYRCLEGVQDLGIKNIHVHKGPTIWPLDKDAFDVSDVDHAATDFPGLNFIVEHVGLPRIEDFCFMATQEPNVYAGLAVVVGGLMHARPRFFAKVMGELLFWLGEDKLLFGSDYAIWEPKWQVEGFVDWDYPDGAEFSEYPRLTPAGKKKILGLNAAALYGLEVPAEFRLPVEAGTPAAPEDARLVEHAPGS